ncbi:hypothetical protein IV203_004193 [Nitzschia inconspicua]|uniref:Uncharacterized protein n=1 Tax=Nitzschia inconspicua TaxID=303405 RepID=A0A9K3PPG8_9STRA|nr:hypothetical protein IV203_004193 [Nitzschia inconspicua]
MTNPHNVDICVTCVSDKPPQLPLREELPSLGIEVVYKAEGVAYQASQEQATRKALNKVRTLRKHKQNHSPKRQDPPEEGQKKPVFAPRKDASGILAGTEYVSSSPKALSYSAYQRSLEKKQQRNEEDSLDSTVESEIDENRPKNKGKRIENAPKPLSGKGSLTKEELALKEAFKIFSDGASTGPKEEESHGVSSNSNPSTLTSLQTNRIEKKKKSPSFIRVVPSGEAKDDFPDLLPSEDETEDDASSQQYINSERDDMYDRNSFGIDGGDDPGEGWSAKNEMSSRDPEFVGTMSPKAGNIKVSLFSHGSNITEMYDLTEVSEADGTNSSFLQSTDQDTSYSRSHSRHTKVTLASPRSYDSMVEVPEEENEFGQLVINLSDVYEENGPGSPLVYSPRPEMEDPSLSSILRSHHSLSPTSPSTQKVQGYGKKKFTRDYSEDLFIDSYNRFNAEDQREDQREDNNVIESPHHSARLRDSMFSPQRDSQVPSIQKASSPVESYHSDRSFSKLRIADSYHDHSRTTRGLKPLSQINEKERFDFPILSATRRSASLSPSPTQSRSNSRPLRAFLGTQRIGSRLTPALKKNHSHDSRGLSRVSFSQDVEERIYRQDDEVIQYKDSMSEVKSPLAAIINEDRDLNDPLPSALSREADEAFRTLADKLGMEQSELRSSELMLVDALSFGEPIPFDFEETLKRNPDLAAERLPETNSYALHAACSRAFPERFGIEQKCRVKDLVDDIVLHQKLVGALVAANPNACMRVDRNGDLPAHIMARQLMEWEAKWYQKVYEKAKVEEREDDNGIGITKLYQTMSECINMLLQPVARNPSLCLLSGNVGRLLPLHIAAIFTVKYSTLLSLLEACPDAASTKCDLSNIRTFIPDHSLPLELHDRLSTDFPKWEIQRLHNSSMEEISQATLDQTYGVKNGMRRSDLMFAFHPDVLPYRKDENRIARMEQRIQQEVMENESLDDYTMSQASASFWIWICEFENPDDIHDHYAKSVERIVSSLPTRAVRYLASVLNEDGRPVIDTVTSNASDVIYQRLKGAAESDIAVPVVSLNTGFSSTEKSFLLRQLDEEMASRFCLHGRGFIGPMCRTLFNISETAFPSSFVLLPYKLVKDKNGRLGLDSAKAAQIAMKFADSLLKLTSTASIIHVLDRKKSRFTGQSLIDEDNNDWWKSQQKQKDILTRFLGLYTDGPAYFYFIDEYTGVPIVDNEKGTYPLAIYEAEDVVRKVFPLMLTGMILMRGEKAVSILANVLLDKNVRLLQPHWLRTAKDLVAYLFSPQIEWTKTSMHELFPIRESLLELIIQGPSGKDHDDGGEGLSSEWVVESSLMKMVVEMHDTRHDYAGLKARRSGFQVMWTLEANFLNPKSSEYLMQIDFMTPEELKRIGMQQRRSLSEVGVASFDGDDEMEDTRTGYDVLFGDLAMTDPQDDQAAEKLVEQATKPQPTIVKMSTSRYPSATQVGSRYAPKPRAVTSMLDFDASLDLDEILKLRIQLDEQEAKLDFLREKIAELEEAETELLDQEEKIGEMINDLINAKENMVQNSSKVELSRARALLLRLCDLEERVLVGEVELGHLKNGITLMELGATYLDDEDLEPDSSFDSQSVYDEEDEEEDKREEGEEEDDYFDEDSEDSDLDVDEDSTLDSFGGRIVSTFQHFTPQNLAHR